MIAPFDEHRDVIRTTGLVLPAELHQAAALFEEFRGFDKGFTRVVWSDGRSGRDLTAWASPAREARCSPTPVGSSGPETTWRFGQAPPRTGRLRRSLGRRFAHEGGEDLDRFLPSSCRAGSSCTNREHRFTISPLRHCSCDGIYGYGTRLSAVIAKHFVARPASASRLLGGYRPVCASCSRLAHPERPSHAGLPWFARPPGARRLSDRSAALLPQPPRGSFPRPVQSPSCRQLITDAVDGLPPSSLLTRDVARDQWRRARRCRAWYRTSGRMRTRSVGPCSASPGERIESLDPEPRRALARRVIPPDPPHRPVQCPAPNPGEFGRVDVEGTNVSSGHQLRRQSRTKSGCAS